MPSPALIGGAVNRRVHRDPDRAICGRDRRAREASRPRRRCPRPAGTAPGSARVGHRSRIPVQRALRLRASGARRPPPRRGSGSRSGPRRDPDPLILINQRRLIVRSNRKPPPSSACRTGPARPCRRPAQSGSAGGGGSCLRGKPARSSNSPVTAPVERQLRARFARIEARHSTAPFRL